MEMLPSGDKGQFTVKYELQDGLSLTKKEEQTEEMRKILSAMPGVAHVYSTNSTS